MTHRYKEPKKKPKPDISYALITLDTAIQNVKAARSIYSNNYYPEAIFFLQQSTEKGCKSFGFYYGIIEKTEVHWKVGHQGSSVFTEELKQFQKIISNLRKKVEFSKGCATKINFEQPFFEKIENDIMEAQKKIQFFSKYYQDKVISDEELQILFRKHYEFERIYETFRNSLDLAMENKDISDKVKNTASDILNSISDRNTTSGVYQKLIDDFDDEVILTMIDFLARGFVSVGPLFELAMITFPHESKSRYAEDQPLNLKYSNDFPLIKNFVELCNLTDKILSNLKNMFATIPSKK